MMLRRGTFILLSAWAAAGLPELPAQTLQPFRAEDDKPVMRAIPVRPPKPLPEDPTEREVPADRPVATPIPMTPRAGARATPLRKPFVPPEDPDVPSAAPTVRKGRVSSSPTPAPAPPKATPMAAPEPADPGEIRISPQGAGRSPDQAQLNVADAYYSKKMYDMAAPEYQRYLELYPNGPERQTALYRLGESYRAQGSVNNAKTAFDTLLAQYQSGEFVGAASYRLAELYYQGKEYTYALPLYQRASVRLSDPAVANAAKFFSARCMEALGRKLDARIAYEEVAEIKESNPFADASRMSLANLLKDAGRTTDALKQIQQVAKQTENQELKAEATVKTGIWLLDIQQAAKAADEFKKALGMPMLGRWKEVAEVGLLRILYDGGKYQDLIDTYGKQSGDFSAETKPEVLLLVANANRQIGKVEESRALYDQVIKEFPTSVYAKDAAFQRLIPLYNAEDPKLITEIDAFLAANPESSNRDQVLLMKAEALYKKQDYPGAAIIYSQIAKSRQLAGNFRAEALMKLGWCSMQISDYDRAIAAFTELMDSHPTHKSIPQALTQRALAYQATKKLAEAERDFSDVIRKWPKAKERELALQKKALLRGQANDNSGMAENFALLLKDYPETPAAPQANYWIGWAAFEAKDYKKAIANLEKARKLDRNQFFERASLRVMLANYYLEDVEGTAREADVYAKEGKGKVPTDVLRWLGEAYSKAGAVEKAAKYLRQLIEREEATPKDWLILGQSQLAAQNYRPAVETFQTYLTKVKEVPSRALGYLELAKAQIGAQEYDAAQKSVDEALTLQPEGETSGEARIIAGDIQSARGQWIEAAKTYESVAVILDDEEITPRALEKAVEAYRKSGNEEQAKKTLNRLQSRYPEYMQRKRVAGKP